MVGLHSGPISYVLPGTSDDGGIARRVTVEDVPRPADPAGWSRSGPGRRDRAPAGEMVRSRRDGRRAMGAMVEYPSNGSMGEGYLAGERGPGVVVIQEWWGLVDHIKDVCDRFAAEGFVALAPDLYHGDRK